MKKKIIAWILAVEMVLPLTAGCNKDQNQSTAPESRPTIPAQDTEQETSSDVVDTRGETTVPYGDDTEATVATEAYTTPVETTEPTETMIPETESEPTEVTILESGTGTTETVFSDSGINLPEDEF